MTTPDPTPASVDSVMTLVLGYGDSTTFEEIIAEVERLAAQSAPLAQQAREYPPLPEGVKARFKCEDCDGTGYTGEMIPGSEFQPPEPVGCTSCNFTGWWAECEAFSVDQMRAYIDADRAAAQVEPPSMPSSEWLAEAERIAGEFTVAVANGESAAAALAYSNLRAHLSKRVTADAVRMLTMEEMRFAWGAGPLDLGIDHQIRQAIKAFCRINAGRTIPLSGEIGGV